MATRLFGDDWVSVVHGVRTFHTVWNDAWQLHLAQDGTIEGRVLATSYAIAAWYVAKKLPATDPLPCAHHLSLVLAVPAPAVRLYRDERGCSVADLARAMHVPLEVAYTRSCEVRRIDGLGRGLAKAPPAPESGLLISRKSASGTKVL